MGSIRETFWSMKRQNRKTSENLRGPEVALGGHKSIDCRIESDWALMILSKLNPDEQGIQALFPCSILA